jgi:hypothetical protein
VYRNVTLGLLRLVYYNAVSHVSIKMTVQNFMHENIKNRRNSGNACQNSVRVLSSRLLSKSVKGKIYKNIILLILPFVLCWRETLSLILREDHRLEVFERTGF